MNFDKKLKANRMHIHQTVFQIGYNILQKFIIYFQRQYYVNFAPKLNSMFCLEKIGEDCVLPLTVNNEV